MKIGIIGRGFVGGAISVGFETQGHEVLVHDTKLNTHQLTALQPNSIIFEVSTEHFNEDSYRIIKGD